MLTGNTLFPVHACIAVITRGVTQLGTMATLTDQQDASISLPPNAFSSSSQGKRVGIFFALYHTPSLFPLRLATELPNSSQGAVAGSAVMGSPLANSSQIKTVVGSGVLATTIGSGIVTNVTPPIEIQLRLTGAPELVRQRGS